jgi:hypothetical protein
LVQRREDYSTSRVCDVWHYQDGQVEGSKRPVGHAKVGASRLCKSGSSKLSKGGDFVFTTLPRLPRLHLTKIQRSAGDE